MHAKTDAELIHDYVANGDDMAFAEVVSRHQNLVFQVCWRLLNNTHEAQDAVQAVFVVLASKAGRLKIEDNLAAWLHGVSRNVALHALRERKLRSAREDAIMRSELEYASEPPVSEEERQVIAGVLDREVAALPVRQREAVILRYMAGLSQEESARATGCTVSALGKRASEGIARLRRRFAKHGLAMSDLALAGAIVQESRVELPEMFMENTLAAVKAYMAGGADGLAAHSGALSFAEATLRGMFWANLKTATAIVGVVALVGGAGILGVANWTATDRTSGPEAGRQSPGSLNVLSGTGITEYVDGEVVFRDDFERDAENWAGFTVTNGWPECGPQTPRLEAKGIRCVRRIESDRDGGRTWCAAARGRDARFSLKQPLPAGSYAIEWERYLLPLTGEKISGPAPSGVGRWVKGRTDRIVEEVGGRKVVKTRTMVEGETPPAGYSSRTFVEGQGELCDSRDLFPAVQCFVAYPYPIYEVRVDNIVIKKIGPRK